MGFAAGRSSNLWRTYETIGASKGARLAMRKVRHRREIYPVFRDLFRRKTDGRPDDA
jgi:hypothetical protein